MRITTIIFDRDGVLTDFELARAQATLQSLLPISFETLIQRWIEWGRVAGYPQDAAADQTYLRGFWDWVSESLDLSPTVRTQLHAFDYLSFLYPYPDARPALLAAKAQGLRTGVLSNFPLASLSASLEVAGFADLIDVAYVARMGGAFKPHPQAYAGILAALQVQPQECLFLDDEPPAVEGARALGMRAYLVDRRREKHQLAEGVICDLTVLPLILEEINIQELPMQSDGASGYTESA